MIDGTVDISNSSRPMTEAEIASARANGNDPVEHIVGYDALAVFLHRDNPLDSLTLSQIADIYAEGGRAARWSDLGVTVPGCPSDEIVRASGEAKSVLAHLRETHPAWIEVSETGLRATKEGLAALALELVARTRGEDVTDEAWQARWSPLSAKRGPAKPEYERTTTGPR